MVDSDMLERQCHAESSQQVAFLDMDVEPIGLKISRNCPKTFR
jgi:hypothetical protein